MEWVLQVVDEIDDAIAAGRHLLLVLNSRIVVLLCGLGAAAAARLAVAAVLGHP